MVAQYAQTRDVAHMSAVADWTTAHDLPQFTLRIGKQMRDLVGLRSMPRSLQKQAYPAGWGDLVAEQAAHLQRRSAADAGAHAPGELVRSARAVGRAGDGADADGAWHRAQHRRSRR